VAGRIADLFGNVPAFGSCHRQRIMDLHVGRASGGVVGLEGLTTFELYFRIVNAGALNKLSAAMRLPRESSKD